MLLMLGVNEPAKKSLEELGKRVRAARKAKGLTQAELGDMIGRDGQSVWNLENAKSAMQLPAMRKLAQALGLELGEILLLAGHGEESSSTNIEPYSAEQIPVEIPEFDLEVAAGGWVEAQQQEYQPEDQRQIDAGLFRIRIRGDSMQPKYPDGSIVEFVVLRQTGDERSSVMEIGKDYCVYKSDGTATFKRLAAADDDSITLKAINPKYKKPLVVSRQEVVRMAKARNIVTPVD